MLRNERTRRALALLALGLLVTLAGCGGAADGGLAGGGGQAASGGDAAEATPGGGGGSYYADGRRVVVRESRMELRVQEHGPAFDRARRVARRHGGFVADWNREVEGDWDRSRLTVRVPASNFSAARDDLAELGAVRSERVRAEEFTLRYADTRARLSDLRAEERQLRRLLDRTNDTEEALRVREDLRQVRERVRDLERRQASIERREALSTIRLTIAEPPERKPPRNYRTAFGFEDAFFGALFGGLRVVKWAIVAVGYLLPVGVGAVGLGLFGWTLLRLGLVAKARVATVLPGPGAPDPGPDGHDRGPAPAPDSDSDSDPDAPPGDTDPGPTDPDDGSAGADGSGDGDRG